MCSREGLRRRVGVWTQVEAPCAMLVAAVTTGRAARMPASLVRLSIRALIATMAELPDMDSAATSGDSVNG